MARITKILSDLAGAESVQREIHDADTLVTAQNQNHPTVYFLGSSHTVHLLADCGFFNIHIEHVH